MSSDSIRVEYDGPVAIMTNNRPEKHNAANDEMDARLWEILEELHHRAIAPPHMPPPPPLSQAPWAATETPTELARHSLL